MICRGEGRARRPELKRTLMAGGFESRPRDFYHTMIFRRGARKPHVGASFQLAAARYRRYRLSCGMAARGAVSHGPAWRGDVKRG